MTYRIHLKKILWIYALAFLLMAFSFHSEAAEKAAKKSAKKDKDVIAVIETNKGTFKAKLFPDKAPKTVENFVGLANGTKEWTDPKTGKKVKKPFYDGLTFHRVVPGFVIQGGDPANNGTGGPGYTFEDEFPADAPKMDKPGVLAMANAGPNTNGSQFFVTLADVARLNSPTPHYTVFGEVIDGQKVVDDIGKVKTAGNEHPVEEVVIKHIKIEKK